MPFAIGCGSCFHGLMPWIPPVVEVYFKFKDFKSRILLSVSTLSGEFSWWMRWLLKSRWVSDYMWLCNCYSRLSKELMIVDSNLLWISWKDQLYMLVPSCIEKRTKELLSTRRKVSNYTTVVHTSWTFRKFGSLTSKCFEGSAKPGSASHHTLRYL